MCARALARIQFARTYHINAWSLHEPHTGVHPIQQRPRVRVRRVIRYAFHE